MQYSNFQGIRFLLTTCFTVVLFVLLFLLGMTSQAVEPIIATPDRLVFNSSSDDKLVVLQAGDTVLSGDEVVNWFFFADDSSYTHMIDVKRAPEGVVISPSETAEVGSYLLVLHTRRGTARVYVDMPLKEHKSIIDKLAEERGVSPEIIRKEMGLSKKIERDFVSFELASAYYVGDTLTLEMPDNGTRYCVWKVNGTPVAEGIGQHSLAHALSAAGPLEVTYEEWLDGVQMNTAMAQSQVLENPITETEAKVNRPLSLSGVSGYGKYTWLKDGTEIGNSQMLAYTFTTPGTYRLVCRASEPQMPDIRSTCEYVYLVHVR